MDHGVGSCQSRFNTFLIKGDIENIDPELRLRYYGTLKKVAKDFMAMPERLPGVCGIWVWGPAGCGKTTSVDRAYPNAYPKPLTKWWDGYQGEEVILLDDMDIFHRGLSSLIKHWADYKPFICENKSGAVYIRPKKIIVTSQYPIEKIWDPLTDPESWAAINRRFTSIEKVAGQDIILL